MGACCLIRHAVKPCEVKALLRQPADATKKLASAHLVLRTTGQIDALAHIPSGDLDVRTIPLAAKGSVTYHDQRNVPFYMANDNVSAKLFDEWTKIGNIEELIAPGLLDPSRGIAAIADGVHGHRGELQHVGYNHKAFVGINVDAAAVPDLNILAGCIREGFDAVIALGDIS